MKPDGNFSCLALFFVINESASIAHKLISQCRVTEETTDYCKHQKFDIKLWPMENDVWKQTCEHVECSALDA